MARSAACQKTAPRAAAVSPITVAEATGFLWLDLDPLESLVESVELSEELFVESSEESFEDWFKSECESSEECPESLEEFPESSEEFPDPSDELPESEFESFDESPEPESPESLESCAANAPDCSEALKFRRPIATGV